MRVCLAAVILVACSDYEFTGEDTVVPGGDDDPGGTPELYLDDCPPGTEAEFESDELYALSWSHETDTGTLVAESSGWFHLYDHTIAESGDTQTNESGFIRVSNGANEIGTPKDANCGSDYVVVDSDNAGELPAGTRVYQGTFYLEAGDNTLTLNHFCPVNRDGSCEHLHITDWDDGTCGSDNPNSIHFLGDGVCLVPADL